jgi:hypothetical protein
MRAEDDEPDRLIAEDEVVRINMFYWAVANDLLDAQVIELDGKRRVGLGVMQPGPDGTPGITFLAVLIDPADIDSPRLRRVLLDVSGGRIKGIKYPD